MHLHSHPTVQSCGNPRGNGSTVHESILRDRDGQHAHMPYMIIVLGTPTHMPRQLQRSVIARIPAKSRTARLVTAVRTPDRDPKNGSHRAVQLNASNFEARSSNT